MSHHTQNFSPHGKHIIAEFHDVPYGVTYDLLDNEERLRNVMLEACKEANLTVLGIMSNKFAPVGVSVLILIMESHLAIHTYPDYHYASIDIYTCGQDVDPRPAFEYLKRVLRPGDVKLMGEGYRKLLFEEDLRKRYGIG